LFGWFIGTTLRSDSSTPYASDVRLVAFSDRLAHVGDGLSLARSQALSQAMMHGVTTGLSTGLMPGINIGRSWQTEDDVADRLTEVLRKLEGLVNTASAEGGFMANALIFTESMDGASAADALAPQAFHGPDVATPILTIAPLAGDEEALRTHALACVPISKTSTLSSRQVEIADYERRETSPVGAIFSVPLPEPVDLLPLLRPSELELRRIVVQFNVGGQLPTTVWTTDITMSLSVELKE